MSIKKESQRPYAARGERVRSSIEAVRKDLASAEEAEDILRKGELLLAHLGEGGGKSKSFLRTG